MKNLRPAIKTYLFALFFILSGGCGGPWRSVPPASEPRYQEADSKKLRDLFDGYFEEILKLSPVFATSIGDHRYDDQLGDGISEEHRERERRVDARYLNELSRLDRQAFQGQERLSYDLLKRKLILSQEELQFNQHLLPVRQLFSTPIEFPLLGSGSGLHPFNTVRDYDNFLKRMEGFQTWVDTAIGNMRKGIEAGFVQPAIVMERTLPQLEAMLVPDVKQSIFYQPILRMPSGFSEAERDRLAKAYAQAIEERIIPTYRKLRAFIKEEYLPKCRNSVAISALSGGSAWYAHLVRVHTTTDMTADQIFSLGRSEIERIKEEIEKLKRQVGFRGSTRDFARHLFENARGYATKEELIRAYGEIRRKVEPQLYRLFGRIPKSPLEIRPVEEFREQSAPSQYWSADPDGSRPGIFYVNGAGAKNRSLRVSESLFLHEAVPGHHFQISLQRESVGLPKFRRFGSYNAFGEGWALYVESLGFELGLYTDPYQYFGRLRSELFRAARLVVDVGLHQKGWTREQALDFMMQNALMGKSGALLEVDRYIAWPGQALAYKIGELKISAIRAKAEKMLGSQFDIRAFHDELLKDGALPLDFLEAKMNAWIENQ